VNIVLFGPPGAGKGTQGDNLVKEFNLFKISTGDLLRYEIKKDTDLGKKIKSIMDSGELVSDDTINSLIEKFLSQKKHYNSLVFDGYPRNIGQAEELDILLKKYKQKISCVLSLKVNNESATKRILGRQICTKCGLTFNKFFNVSKKENHNCGLKYLITRSDDNEKVIKNRFATYTKETLPILNYYQNQKILYEIDGMGEIGSIYKEIREIIHSLET